MPNYDNNLKGALYKNDRKRDDKDPGYTGSCEIDGKQFWLSAWLKESGPQSKTPGQKFFSISFRAKDAPPQQAPAARPAAAPAAKPKPQPVPAQTDMDDDPAF